MSVYELHVVVTDRAGNATVSDPVTDVRVDNTPPTTSQDELPPNLRGTVTLSGAAGNATGGSAVTVGHEGARSAHQLAVFLGLLIWGLPTLLLVVFVLPRRVAEIRRLQELRRIVQGPDAERLRGMLALRAAEGGVEEGELFSRRFLLRRPERLLLEDDR